MWVLNIFLYLCFFFNPAIYTSLVEAGAPCYGYIGDKPDGPPPPCFYLGGK